MSCRRSSSVRPASGTNGHEGLGASTGRGVATETGDPKSVIFNVSSEHGLYKDLISSSVRLILIKPDSGSVHQRGGAETL